ncbi:hypothetical protein PACTADRAFT_50644 [Pachysolen tannophilus NRRL Y-2460]|uniref:Uncharacterized protein n=1 Tax=Pachysolen tannophilus NRRL Y-2460 TaxID=669874 RepID=A0A1E4TSQ7_PACTA|nr:hypothetical protein PACTADRAFT_50644 [Pachysolen tannophilus NRRL Y-2460]
MSLTTSLTQEEIDVIIDDARYGDLEELQEIFKEVDPSLLLTMRDEYTLNTPIHMAAANGHTEVIKYLLSLLSQEEQRKLVNLQNENGNTPLHWGSLNGNLEVIETLCSAGADPFMKNKANHDAIYEAENNGKEECENYFLNKFAVEPQQDDDQEETQENGESIKVTVKEGTEIFEATREGVAAEEQRKLQSENELEQKTNKLTI